MQNILICDDMEEQSAALAKMVSESLSAMHRTPARIDTCASASALFSAMEKTPYGIIFLDIQLAGDDGVGIAVKLNSLAPDVQIIFISAYLASVTRIYDAKHLYFLAKPIQQARLSDALLRACKALAAIDAERLELPLLRGTSRLIPYQQILYCERTGRVTVVHCVGGEQLITKKTVAELAELLPSERFARPHSSFLVQLARVISIDRLNVTIDGDTVLPISNARRQGFRTQLESHLLQ